MPPAADAPTAGPALLELGGAGAALPEPGGGGSRLPCSDQPRARPLTPDFGQETVSHGGVGRGGEMPCVYVVLDLVQVLALFLGLFVGQS